MPAFSLFAAIAALLAAVAPLPLSFASVWLFAGPHNWMEARYFMSLLPSRWLVRRPFFLAATTGTLVLGLAFAVNGPTPFWFTTTGLWILALTRLAGRDAALPAGPICLAIALAWYNLPIACLGLLYLHPLVALWFLFRQAGKRNPGQTKLPYALLFATLAAVVITIRWNTPGPETSYTGQALTALPTQPPLIALHAYLELLHYGAWVVAIPLTGLKSKPWHWQSIPLAKRYPQLIKSTLILGALAVFTLWLALTLDYDTARQIYFTVAIFHVLAEAPMLIWLR